MEDTFEQQKRERYGEMEDQANIDAETEEEIKSIRQDYHDNKNNVVEFLIESVLNVNLEIPRVVRGDFSSTQ